VGGGRWKGKGKEKGREESDERPVKRRKGHGSVLGVE
jgi:hypothetical protein